MYLNVSVFSLIKEIACERECSRGEDYRLIKLTITDYNSKRERDVVVECRGHDAARLCNVDHAHGWEKDVVEMLDQKNGKRKIYISFDCETLKAEDAAEDHIRKFMPKLAGMGAVVNVGTMSITGLEFETEAEHEQFQQNVLRCTSSPVPNRKVEVNIGPTSSTDFGFEEAVPEQVGPTSSTHFGFEEEAVPEQIQQKTSQDECSQI